MLQSISEFNSTCEETNFISTSLEVEKPERVHILSKLSSEKPQHLFSALLTDWLENNSKYLIPFYNEKKFSYNKSLGDICQNVLT